MRVFSIAGLSNSGKTTLVVQVVQALSSRGYAVITIKSTKDDVYPPQESDTFKHLDAGAKTTVLLGPSSTTIRHKHRIDLQELKSINADFMIIEGMKSSNIPKIWCEGTTKIEHADIPPRTVAIVRRGQFKGKMEQIAGIPLITPNEIGQIVKIIEELAINILELEEVLRET